MESPSGCNGKDVPIEVIERWLKGWDCCVRQAAMNACNNKDVPIEVIERWLKDEEYYVRQAAINVIKNNKFDIV